MSLTTDRTDRRVGRRQVNFEQTPARFPEGTLKAVDATLEKGEKRSDFIRQAVETELNRRLEAMSREPEREAPEISEEDSAALSSMRA